MNHVSTVEDKYIARIPGGILKLPPDEVGWRCPKCLRIHGRNNTLAPDQDEFDDIHSDIHHIVCFKEGRCTISNWKERICYRGKVNEFRMSLQP